ncbi:MAG: hypothetical protein Q9165_003449 [Trypethelium subeluteriae]
MAILDERHQQMTGQDKHDDNNYILGRIYEHNIVIACLPIGVYGTVSAARVARDMLRTFTGLRFGLMVGIGGGIPDLQNGVDIRLGDVVVSEPDRIYGGVVQYDLGKIRGDDDFERKGLLRPPPTLLLAALATLRAEHDLDDSQVPDIVAQIYHQHSKLRERGYAFPGRENDNLYCSQCSESSSDSCNLCVDGKIKRQDRLDRNPAFWYGVIASGNELIQNAVKRDRFGRELGALCVEMEAAGLMNDFPCIVIRGICDYADSYKDDTWQKYAALTAAAYTKEFLAYISPEQTSREKPVQEIANAIDKQSHLMEEHLHEIKRQHNKRDQRYLSDRGRECHQIFKTSTYEQFKNINCERTEGTCQWVLSHPRYRQWATKGHDDLLWISADPGCGKSVLAKSLVDNELRATDKHTVCYFFFKDNDEQDGLATALCAILHQLFYHQPQLVQYAIPAWESIGDKLVKDIPELWRTLLAAARSDVVYDVTCVLDALDECRLHDRRLLIDMLADFYMHTLSCPFERRRGRLRFLVTSRPYDDIRAEFQKTLDDLPTIRLRGEEENDQIHQEIDLVIRKRVKILAKDLRLDVQTTDRLETQLLKMEHRTYLWLYLAIESIYETFRDSIRPEEASIESLPTTVEDAYEGILSRVSEKQIDNVKKIFTIVIGARRPLTVQEMAIALGVATKPHPESIRRAQLNHDYLENRMRHWCGLFIFIKHTRIYLIHQTAKEFLICDSNSIDSPFRWKRCLYPHEVEKEMTRICIEVLHLEYSQPVKKSQLRNSVRDKKAGKLLHQENNAESFVIYSAESWPHHFRNANVTMNESFVSQASNLYNTDSTLYRRWFAIFWRSICRYLHEPQMDSLRLAALLGHKTMLEGILQSHQRCDIDESDENGQTALIWASTFGFHEAVQLLLNNGANVNAKGGSDGSALHAASSYGHEMVVKTLLNQGADINARKAPLGSALQAASAYGEEKMVKLLLDQGVDFNAQRGNDDSALHTASLYGQKKVVKTLLEHGADINAQVKPHGTALQAASWRGHEKVVKLLLDQGADINAQRGNDGSALHAASLYGQKKVVKTLLEHGADINAQVNPHGTALQAASRQGHEKVVKMLLDQGADINAQGEPHGNALQAASLRGNKKVVKVLLDHGADINAQGGPHGNALQTASYRDHEEVVKMLLDHGADINAQGGHYGSALQAAMYWKCGNVVEILLNQGDLSISRAKYDSFIQTSQDYGNVEVTKMLLDRRADIKFRD